MAKMVRALDRDQALVSMPDHTAVSIRRAIFADLSHVSLVHGPAFAQQEHPVHIWDVIWVCAPNVPISNISFTAGMRPCHVPKMYPPGTF